MILYFSATGNTKLMAETLAERLNDESADLLLRIKNNDYSEIHSDRPFIICSPVYVSELPCFVSDYLKKVSFSGCPDAYGIFTNGGYSGIAGGQLKKIIAQKNMRFNGYAEFKLPSNHMTNRSHKDLDETEIINRIKTSLGKVGKVAGIIQNGSRFRNRHIFLLEYIVTLPIAPVLCYYTQGTKGFRAKDNCISCGKCAKLCPMNVIELNTTTGKEKKMPVWVAERCAHCMSCIQNCPVEAIEYLDITEGRKRYNVYKYPIAKP